MTQTQQHNAHSNRRKAPRRACPSCTKAHLRTSMKAIKEWCTCRAAQEAAADTYVRTCACGRLQRSMRENHTITTRSAARKERARPGRASDAGCEDLGLENSSGASRGLAGDTYLHRARPADTGLPGPGMRSHYRLVRETNSKGAEGRRKGSLRTNTRGPDTGRPTQAQSGTQLH